MTTASCLLDLVVVCVWLGLYRRWGRSHLDKRHSGEMWKEKAVAALPDFSVLRRILLTRGEGTIISVRYMNYNTIYITINMLYTSRLGSESSEKICVFEAERENMKHTLWSLIQPSRVKVAESWRLFISQPLPAAQRFKVYLLITLVSIEEAFDPCCYNIWTLGYSTGRMEGGPSIIVVRMKHYMEESTIIRDRLNGHQASRHIPWLGLRDHVESEIMKNIPQYLCRLEKYNHYLIIYMYTIIIVVRRGTISNKVALRH